MSVSEGSEQKFKATVNSLHRKWTTAANEVQNIAIAARDALKNEGKVMEFFGMHRSLEKYFSRCEELIESMEDAYAMENKLEEFQKSKRTDQHNKVKAYYYEASTAYETLNARKQAVLPPVSSNLQNVTIGERSGPSSNLPRINIPKFDGKYSNWPKFRDTFTSIVDQNQALSPMEKFHYLTASLVGNAAAVIGTFSLEEQNYSLAWKALVDVYENKRLLANAYLAQLLQFKPQQGKPNVLTLLNFLSSVADNISAFKLLKIPDQSEFILFYLAFRCLDSQTKEQFELANRNVDFPTFDALIKHVREKCLALQLTEGSFEFESNSHMNFHSKINPSDIKTRPVKNFGFKTKSTLVANEARSKSSEVKHNNFTNTQVKCVICSEMHSLLNCTLFYSLAPEERIRKLKNWAGCTNCLNSYHSTQNCRSKWHCRFCTQRHHALLHPSSTPKASTQTLTSAQSINHQVNSAQQALHSSCDSDSTEVILGTALVSFMDSRGHYQKFRVVLDSGSCSSFMTTRCQHRLGLSMTPTAKRISSLGGSLFDGAKGKVLCTLRSSDNLYEFSTEAIVVKNITNYMPVMPVPYDIWRHYVDFELADPKFWEPAPIDFLLGADLYGEIMSGNITTIRDDIPKLFHSVFGLIVMGKYVEPCTTNSPANLLTSCLFSSTVSVPDDMSFDLSKFWQVEETPESRKILSPDEEKAETHFRDTHHRTETGRYVVRLPFKEPDVVFPTSFYVAKHRLINLESKLRLNPNLAMQYHAFMKEYLDLGHMKPTDENPKFVIPHHCVSKVDRGEVKIRVVFDGSVRTSQGSLNDNLLVGPPLQNDIRNILLNFRVHPVVFVTDAVKCYRQILVDPQDRPYQQILWRFDTSDAVQTYNLCTVTYGLSCSPYLSLRVIKALVADEGDDFPKAAEVIMRDIYIDDLVTGASCIEEALELQNQVVKLMGRGGFELGKWASNRQELLDAVNATADSSPDVSWHGKDDSSIKVLGLKWAPTDDCFSYQLSIPPTTPTKRGILSTIARVYDPLGFISPFVFLMKTYIQELWKLKLDWDDRIPDDLCSQWITLIQQLQVLHDVNIPRFVTTREPFTYNVIGFSDASQRGYCGVLYLRVENQNGIFSHLLTAKTKLAPVKTISIPRLELCGAYLLAKLYSSVSGFLSLLPTSTQPPKFFSDSMIVLGWLKTPTYKLNTFVGNRISQILELTTRECWSHVEGQQNPSDLGSRGCLPHELINNDLWWKGPAWLCKPMNEWPCNHELPSIDLPELKTPTEFVMMVFRPHLQDCIKWMEKVSSYKKLIRAVAILNQGMAIFKSQAPFHNVTPDDYLRAELLCVKAVQNFYFFNGTEPKISTLLQKFASLNVYLDSDGIVRVGGRLSKAQLPDSQKYPILLPNEAHFSKILVDEYHQANAHPGPNLQQALIQLRFWIPALRRVIRQRTFKCLKCYKMKAKFTFPMMGDLPSYRLQGGRVFTHVGCDFAGPFLVKESNRRKAPVTKAYLCLYVCMTTKALHLEIVSSLSTEAFLASFSRFISRRGLPTDIYSDCGSNFKGAARELQELLKWFTEEQTQSTIQKFAVPKGIKWHFNPPYSPHFGGLWEAGVKSVKRHLYLSVGNLPLTLEELSTFFCKIEAILNSRPLCPLSTDPGELDYLSPGHFLVGGNLLQPPEPSLLDIRENRLSKWQIIQQISQRIWQRWRLEYLATLQARSKWSRPKDNLQIGDLVLIKTADSPQLRWPVGRVVDVHPGTDGAIRVVTLKTPHSTFQRTTANLIPLLPLNDSA